MNLSKPASHDSGPLTYLACDKAGLLSATSEAVSPAECFAVVVVAAADGAPGGGGGAFGLQTLRGSYVAARTARKPSAAPAEVRGDEEDGAAASAALRIRMQARFKPRLKASREEKALARISRRELEAAAGRRLGEDEVRVLKRARREGDYHEKLLDFKVKNRHDKFG
ncbi:hypothetical protein UVI_02018010 [Ustilaginoidea virens]|uniref:FRG1-like family protein n=1 Tax=Ustilaginoidea virens TaxID=1159556 RepID=A0A1B5KS64_USTVR|nr:hypothetical protein UVI_02018010 [Ustilaginoidea virens]